MEAVEPLINGKWKLRGLEIRHWDPSETQALSPARSGYRAGPRNLQLARFATALTYGLNDAAATWAPAGDWFALCRGLAVGPALRSQKSRVNRASVVPS